MRKVIMTLLFVWGGHHMPSEAFSGEERLIELRKEIEGGLIALTEAPVGILAPALTNSLVDLSAAAPIFHSLVKADDRGRMRDDQGHPYSDLADVRVSEDGLTYEFYIRGGIQFHSVREADGRIGFVPTRNLNARDVFYTFMRYHAWNNTDRRYIMPDFYRGPVMKFPPMPENRRPTYYDLKLREFVESMEVDPSNQVFRLKLKRPNFSLLDALMMNPFGIQSEEYALKILNEEKVVSSGGSQYDLHPVGTGAYAFEEMRANGTVILRVHQSEADRLGIRPAFARVILVSEPDANERVRLVGVGLADVALSPGFDRPPPQTQILRQEVRNLSFMMVHPQMFGLPAEDELSDEQRNVMTLIRQAISMAIDREAIVRVAHQEEGAVASSLVDPALFSGQREVHQHYKFNLGRAQAKLADAQKEFLNLEKRKLPLDLTLYYIPASRPYSPNSLATAQIIADNLKQLGFNVELKTTASFGEYIRLVTEGAAALILYGDNPLNNGLDRLFNLVGSAIGVSNYARWRNKVYDELARELLTLAPDDLRWEKALLESEKLVAEFLPLIGLSKGHLRVLVRRGIRIKMDSLAMFNWLFAEKICDPLSN